MARKGAGVRVALAQVDAVSGDVDANVARAEEMIRAAVADGAQVVIFPELHLSGYQMGSHDVWLDIGDPRLEQLAGAAAPGAVVLGFPESSTSWERTYNTAACFVDGRLVHRHRKLYLPNYGIFEERKHFSPGSEIRAFDLSGSRVAVLVCNDAWQAVVPFLAVQDGARVLFHTAASAQSRFPEHYDSERYWRDLSRFYGRMYQSYVVFVNRVGREGELEFFGRSHVVDPWGELVHEAAEGVEDLAVVELDLDLVRRRRRDVPLIREARLALLEREIRRLAAEGGDL